MTDFGITPQGFNRKLLQDILTSIGAAQQAIFGALLDVGTTTELGQLNGTFASGLAECWELLEEAYHGFDPDAAEDFLLTILAALTGTERRAAAPSTFKAVTLNALVVNLNAGAVAAAGAIVGHSTRPDITFTLDATVTNTTGSAADFTVDATCTQTGPTGAVAGSITLINNPASGWNSVNNPADVTLGRVVDSNQTLRLRRESELALRGGSTVAAIKADLLDSKDHPELIGIESVECLENTGDSIDTNGLPAHSICTIIYDGPTPSVANNDVAQAIFETKPAGAGTYGAVAAFALDANGDEQPINFARSTPKPVYFAMTLTKNTNYPIDGDAQVKTALVALGAPLQLGDDVVALAFRAAVLVVPGVVDVPVFTLGFAPSPAGTGNLAVGSFERATFNSANISVS